MGRNNIHYIARHDVLPEEAEWWDAHPEYINQIFRDAKAKGRLTKGSVAKRLGLVGHTPAPIPLSKEDLDLARAQADKQGC